MPEHEIDSNRIVVHDLDRAGDYYDAWCVCGAQVAAMAPHLKEKYGPGGSVESGMQRHLSEVSKQAEEDRPRRLEEALRACWDEYHELMPDALHEQVKKALGIKEFTATPLQHIDGDVTP